MVSVLKIFLIISLFCTEISSIFIDTSLKCNLCIENGLLLKHGINRKIINDIEIRKNISKRSIDPTFRGHPKTKAETLAINFNMDAYKGSGSEIGQSISLIALLNKIATEYLNRCPPFILYDAFVENSDSFILQNLFQSFPFTFYHGKVNKKYQLEKQYLIDGGDNNCKSYILFLSDPMRTQEIIGPQMENKVIVVSRSSQWKLRDFLSSEASSKIINLLVVGESLSTDSKKEMPFVLYTHRLYADGLGSNVPVVLTTWIKGMLSRPHIDLFPPKFINGFAGHRFVIAAVNQPPFIFREKFLDNTGTMNVYWEGIEYRLMILLSQRLNFSFEITEPVNTLTLGSGEAVREEVQLGRADIGMAGAYITIDRLQNIDMSVGHTKDCAAFITLASKALPKYRAIMGPFQWPVWVALTLVYLLGIFPLAYTDRLSLAHVIGNWGEIENMFWYVFGTFTNSLSFSGKYSWSNSEKLSTRLLIGFYWMFTIIITACYTGSIIAFVTLPAFPNTVDSVYDLLGLFFRVSTLDKGGWNMWFNNSEHEATAKLYKKMEFVSTIDEGIGNVTRSFFWNYAFLGSKAQLEYLIQSNYSGDGMSKRSILHLSNECFAPFQVGYTFPKNSVYAKSINEVILRIQRSGLMIKLENEVSWIMQRSSTGRFLQASSGFALKERIREERQLTTADTEGMFLLMGIGYLLAALALVSEIIGGFTNKCRQVIKRRRKSNISATSSSSAGSAAHKRTEQEVTEHLERKVKRKKDHDAKRAAKSRFPGLNELNLTRATLKELYSGYNKRQPILIMQNNQLILENEAISEDSSLYYLESSSDKVENQSEHSVSGNGNFQFDATIHQYDNDGKLEQIDENIELNIAKNTTENIYPNLEDSFGETVDHSIKAQEDATMILLNEHSFQ